MRLLLNKLQRQKTILILNDNNTFILSNNVSYLEFRFICVIWWLFETKAFHALRKRQKLGNFRRLEWVLVCLISD